MQKAECNLEKRDDFRARQKAYGTRDSQAVSDPSTNRAQRCLTCQIGRDGVLSTWYGRKRRQDCGESLCGNEKSITVLHRVGAEPDFRSPGKCFHDNSIRREKSC